MNVMVFRPDGRALSCAAFKAQTHEAVCVVPIEDGRFSVREEDNLTAMMSGLEADFRDAVGAEPEVIAVYAAACPAGCPVVADSPVMATADVVNALDEVVTQAPFHLPALLRLVAGCRAAFTNTPVVLVFGSAFFKDLPLREQSYGVAPDLARKLALRRSGYHGVFHEAACHLAMQEHHKYSTSDEPRVLSICLEPRPEVVGAIGARPVMVSGGTSPLEGLPGQTTCGEMDPGVVLNLLRKKDFGLERVNRILTRKSGLKGLVGRDVTLAEVWESDSPDIALARDLLPYRLRQACGMAMAALGGIDAIIFSGRYAHLGGAIGEDLAARLTFRGAPRAQKILVTSLTDKLERLVADRAVTFLAGQRLMPVASDSA